MVEAGPLRPCCCAAAAAAEVGRGETAEPAAGAGSQGRRLPLDASAAGAWWVAASGAAPPLPETGFFPAAAAAAAAGSPPSVLAPAGSFAAAPPPQLAAAAAAAAPPAAGAAPPGRRGGFPVMRDSILSTSSGPMAAQPPLVGGEPLAMEPCAARARSRQRMKSCLSSCGKGRSRRRWSVSNRSRPITTTHHVIQAAVAWNLIRCAPRGASERTRRAGSRRRGCRAARAPTPTGRPPR